MTKRERELCQSLSQIAEQGNARLIVDNDCGCLAPNPEAILEALNSAFVQGEKRLKTWVTNIGRLSKPDASLQIARFILELTSAESGPPEKMQHLLPAESEGKNVRSILRSDSIYSQGI